MLLESKDKFMIGQFLFFIQEVGNKVKVIIGKEVVVIVVSWEKGMFVYFCGLYCVFVFVFFQVRLWQRFVLFYGVMDRVILFDVSGL